MNPAAEWRSDDRVRAEKIYALLNGQTKLFVDFLTDHPGERVGVDQIVAYYAQRTPKGRNAPQRLSVAASLTPLARWCGDFGRRVPYDLWPGIGGSPSFYSMRASTARLFRDARMKIDPGYDSGITRKADWSNAEVEATVADYLDMLVAETAGQRYSKADHRRRLRQQLNPVRTDSAIEFKHQNISAAMLDLGLPYIRGYKPLGNYQAALAAEIERRLRVGPQLLRALKTVTDEGTPAGSDLQRTPVPAPPAAGAAPAPGNQKKGRHRDYGLLQEENRRLGQQGEELVADFERAWLRDHGRPDLASRVQWAARDDGDGLGYDVLSFDLSGQERHIEVKTTALGAETPFYITSPELAFAQSHADRYALRVIHRAGE